MTNNLGLEVTKDWINAVTTLSLTVGDQYSVFNNGNAPVSLWIGNSGDNPVQKNSITINQKSLYDLTYEVAAGEGFFVRSNLSVDAFSNIVFLKSS